MGASHKKISRNGGSNATYLLDSTNIKELRQAKEINEKKLRFSWAHYSDLASQRHVVYSELQNTIIANCTSFNFSKWQRAVKYKYALHPLCTIGSYQFTGGRFNYGNSINTELSAFPALYIAQDKDTAIQEHLGQEPISNGSKLTPRDLALTATDSEALVSVSGQIEKVFDLTNKNNLNSFVDLIKQFKPSNHLIQMAREAKMGKMPLIIKSVAKLLDSLLDPHWRSAPDNYDIPSNSQIFGHMCYTASIEGILYPSKFTKKHCLVVFPNNFPNTSSFVTLDGELPPHGNIPTRIDEHSYKLCEIND